MNFKLQVALLLFCSSSLFSVKAQVSTRKIPRTLSEIVTKKRIPKVKLPKVNTAQLMQEDRDDISGLPPRFGKAMEVNIDLEDGIWEEYESKNIWRVEIESEGALSLNLIFDKFRLEPGTELFLFNKEKDIVFGPVTSLSNNAKNIFSTDLIKGDVVKLEMHTPKELTKKNIIKIGKVIHGYKDISNYVGFGDSAPCHTNIECSQGNNWTDESDAVALVLVDNGQRHCSGILLNNSCQDLTPNFLTAFHCLDRNANGELSLFEMDDVENWVFRFNYKSSTCGGLDGFLFYSISGSDFRSAWFDTDFALLELFQIPVANKGVNYAGWSRNSSPASSAVSIHHPRGDVMKISTDNDPII